MKKKMLSAMLFLLKRDFEATTRYLLDMAEYDDNADTDGFRKELHALYSEWYGTSIREYSLTLFFYRELKIGARFSIVFHSGLILLSQSMMTIETVGREIDPEMDIVKIGKPILERFFVNQFSPEKVWANIQRQAPDYLDFLERLSEIVMNIYARLESGNFEVNFSDKTLKKLNDSNRSNSHKIALSVILAGLILSGSILSVIPVGAGYLSPGIAGRTMLVAGAALAFVQLIKG